MLQTHTRSLALGSARAPETGCLSTLAPIASNILSICYAPRPHLLRPICCAPRPSCKPHTTNSLVGLAALARTNGNTEPPGALAASSPGPTCQCRLPLPLQTECGVRAALVAPSGRAFLHIKISKGGKSRKRRKS
jgi:hypothetical protein